MTNYLLRLDQRSLRLLREAGAEAARMGDEAYVVGGIVRDLILRRPNLDLDIVVEGDATRLARHLAKRWGAKLTVYKVFGTATLRCPDGRMVDLATARQEAYLHPGALPTVRPGRLEEDLIRRDITINAMAIALCPERFGELVDLHGGRADSKRGIVRVLHDQSFVDDPTRILRVVRFEQRFGFSMTRRTLSLLKDALRKDVYKTVKPPRLFAVLKKLLCEEDPVKGLRRLHCLGGLRFIDPALKVDMRSLNALNARIKAARSKDIYRREDWWLVYFMGLVRDNSSARVERILAGFPFTREARESVRQARRGKELFAALSVRKLRASDVDRILQPLNTATILYLRVASSRVVVTRRIDRYLARDRSIAPRINGEDLKRMGFPSGRCIGEVLDEIRVRKIDGKLRTRRDELSHARLVLRGLSDYNK